MNLSPDFTRDAAFTLFKKDLGHDAALEFIFNLCAKCQLSRTTKLYLPDDDLRVIMGLPEDMSPGVVKEVLKHRGMVQEVPNEPDTYQIDVFIEQNGGLLGAWKGGREGGRPKRQILSERSFPSINRAQPPGEQLDDDVPFN